MLSIITSFHNLAFNLALEEHLLRTLPLNHLGYFLLWQIPRRLLWGGISALKMKLILAYVSETGLPVVRRMTGGGVVYHDLGNLNFSFIYHCGSNYKLDQKPFSERIVAALSKVGVKANVTGQNDIEVEGHKISGNAQLQSARMVRGAWKSAL